MGLPDIDPFVQTPDGRAFYPYHRLAAGYLIPPADEASLRRFLRRMRWVPFALVMLFLFVKPWSRGYEFEKFLIFVALNLCFWFAVVAFRCRGLARTRSPMPRLDGTRRAAAGLTTGFIVFGLLTCLLFTVGGVMMFWYGVGDPTMNIVSVILFGGLWLWYCRIALIKWRERAPS